MNGVSYFLGLAEQTYSVMAYFSPLTLLLAAWLVVGWGCGFARRGGRWRLLAFGCLPPFVTPVAVLVTGAVFVHDPIRAGGAPAPTFPVLLLYAHLILHVGMTAALLRVWRGRRAAVVASAVFAGYVSLCAAFISAMSVTGDWL